MKVLKAKIIKNGCLEVTYVNENDNVVTVKGGNICHPDFRFALKKLVPFFADVTEQAERRSIDWNNPNSEDNMEVLGKISVNGIVVTEDGASMIGARTLEANKVIAFNSPQIGFEPETECYPRCEEYRDAIEEVRYEASLYITHNKWESTQAKFNDNNADDPFAS